MKLFIVNILLLFFISIIIWLATYQKQQSTEKKQSVLTLADASFIIQKEEGLKSVKKGLLFFTAKIQKLTINQWKITIELNGDVDGAADAADLRLDFPESLTVSDLKVGPAFPLYPRKVVTTNYLLVTGLASIINNKMIFGQPNKIFVEFTIQTTDNQFDKKQITVNKEGTKVYLNGESVLDTGKSL